jgi:hypothetical protein
MRLHRASGCCLSMIFSENRFTLFRIMLELRQDAPSVSSRTGRRHARSLV